MPWARLEHLVDISPHCRAMRLHPASGAKGGAVSIVLPSAPFLSVPGRPEELHPGAIGSVADTVCSIGALGVLPEACRVATIDLRWDLLRRARLTDVAMTATQALAGSGAVHVLADIVEVDTGALLGSAQSCHSYSTGSEYRPLNVPDQRPAPSSALDLREWLGLEPPGFGTTTTPHRQDLLGMYGLPYFHGGALTAALAAAALDRARLMAADARLATATVSFDIFRRPIAGD